MYSYLDNVVDDLGNDDGNLPGIWRGYKWTAHSVVQHMYSDKCSSRTDKLAGGMKRGSQPWLAKYNKAVQDVLAELDEDKLQEVEDQANAWNKQGLDPAMQEK